MAVHLSPLTFQPTNFSPLSSSSASSVISSCSFRRAKRSHPVLTCGFGQLLGSPGSGFQTLRRSCSNSSSDFSDDEVSEQQTEELSKRLDLSNHDDDTAVAGMSMKSNFDQGSDFSEKISLPESETDIPDPTLAGDFPAESQMRILEYCSVKKAFLSMVFMIRELQSYALHIREHLTCEDLQGIMAKVQKEMNASFVWLFQQVFSQTPTLMVYVMILLANFTVHSMTHNAARSTAYGSVTVTDSERRDGDAVVSPLEKQRFKTDEDWPELTGKELRLWNSIVEEALSMQAELGGFAFDHETMKRLVSPLTVEIEKDDYEEYFRTDLVYRIAISHDPNNPMLLTNYAQFLYLVVHDHDRAEEFFKRAVSLEPPDAEALGSYADYLWAVKNDNWEAEERYQQAMEVDPHNSHHSSKYAHFLWQDGGKDTCFPLQDEEEQGQT